MARTYSGDGIVQRRKTWWLDCLINGVRYQRKLGKGISRSVALELSMKYRVEILSGNVGYGKKAKDPTLSDASKKFLDWVISEKKANTLRGYKACLNTLKKTFGTTRLSAITPWALEAYKKKRGQGRQLTDRPTSLSDAEWARRCRVAEGGAPIRANRELAVLKTLFSKCRDWGLYEGENPVCKVKFRKEPRQRFRILEPEEEVRLLAVCTEPLRTLIVVGLHTGIRIQAEAMTLKRSSLDLKRGTLTVESAYAKNGKSRTVSLNSVVRQALEQLPKTGDLVFQHGSVGLAFRKACKTAGISGVTPHTLRHTFASRLVMSGVDLRTVQELGGWQTIGMVERYSHLSRGHQADALERLAYFHSAPQKALGERNAPAC
jgi:integrase